jgi:hypothetical protein
VTVDALDLVVTVLSGTAGVACLLLAAAGGTSFACLLLVRRTY